MSYPIKAKCDIAPKGKPCGGGEEEAPGCTGVVTLTQVSADETVIEWDLKGCGKEGLHGFHIHELADFSNGCMSAGPHYNPFGKEHGAPEDENRHVGDMGNITVDAEGNSKGSLKDKLIKLEGPYTVVGRSVMVHADPDDLGKGDNSDPVTKPPVNGKCSKVTGNAGARIGCGEIKLAYPIKAKCDIAPKGKPCGDGEEQAPGCVGVVYLTQVSADETVIEWDLKGCGKEGLHGFHIHELADFSNGCMSAGPHYNPFGKEHGAPEDENRHVGDMGNITVDAEGNSKGSLKDKLIKLEGPYTVVGRSVMVHADPDDLGKGDNSDPVTKPPVNGKCSKVTGNAGARIGCGEIVLI